MSLATQPRKPSAALVFTSLLLLLALLSLSYSTLNGLTPSGLTRAPSSSSPSSRLLRVPVQRVPLDPKSPRAQARRALLTLNEPARTPVLRRRLMQEGGAGATDDRSSSSAGGSSGSTAVEIGSSSSGGMEPSSSSSASASSSSADSSSGAAEASSSSSSSSSSAASTASSSSFLFSSTGPSGNSSIPPLPVVVVPARVHLRDYSDYMYIGVVGVGTPPQYFGCVFDTGSADTWVFSSEMPKHLPQLHYFDASASSTFVRAPGRRWGIGYGKGSASGFVSQDTLWIGGLPVPKQPLAFTTQVGDATTFSQESQPIDGLLGLGFQGLATPAFGTSFMQHAWEIGAIPERVFSFHMGSTNTDPVDIRPNTDGTGAPIGGGADELEEDALDALAHPGSFFILGGSDDTLAPRGMSYTSIIDPSEVEGRWALQLESLSISGSGSGSGSGSSTVAGFCDQSAGALYGCVAWIDTGSSFILLPETQFERIMRLIVATRPDCTVSARVGTSIEQRASCSIRSFYLLPTISFRFGGVEFLLTPEEYVVDGLSDDSAETLIYLLGFAPKRATPKSQGQYEEIIIGDTFLKKSDTIHSIHSSSSRLPDGHKGAGASMLIMFYMERNRIGFANREAPYEITWWMLLLIMMGTGAVMALGIACVRRKFPLQQQQPQQPQQDGSNPAAVAAAVAAGAGSAAANASNAPASPQTRASSAASAAGRVLGLGRGRARAGYAQVSSSHADLDADMDNDHADHNASTHRGGEDADEEAADDIEMARMNDNSNTSAPLSPSQVALDSRSNSHTISHDDLEAMDQL